MDCENLVEFHGGFIFSAEQSSKGVDSSGEEYDHSFSTENGRVSYDKEENGTYIVTFKNDEKEEKRVLDFDQLKDWFYAPTVNHYEDVISKIDLIN